MPYRRPWSNIGSGHRPINVEQNAWFIACINSRYRYLRTRITITTVGDVDLGARNVELSTAKLRSTVKSNVFDADEILTAREGVREVECELCEAICWIGDTATTIGHGVEFGHRL